MTQCDSRKHDGRRTWPTADVRAYFPLTDATRDYCSECWEDLEPALEKVEVQEL